MPRCKHTILSITGYPRKSDSKFACHSPSIWCLKYCILALYSKIVQQLEEYKRYIKYIWIFFFLTFVGAMLSTFVECRPFKG